MNARDLLEKIGESLATTASVRSVFGEPIHTEGKTVVPIARIAYGYGAGSGNRPGKSGTPDHPAEGGGGGGGVAAMPAGALEITASHTRFVPFLDARRLGIAFATGFLLGGILLSKLARSRDVRQR